jgi:hypothetical protein
MIQHQMTGPATVIRLECPTLQSMPLYSRNEHGLIQKSKTVPMAGDVRSNYMSSNKYMAIRINKNDWDKTIIQCMLAWLYNIPSVNDLCVVFHYA